MIELLIPLLLADNDNTPVPPDHVQLRVWDDPIPGHAACIRMLADEPPGTSCIVLPMRAPLDTTETAHHYVEWTDPATGAKLCTKDLQQDRNPESSCETRPLSEYPGK